MLIGILLTVTPSNFLPIVTDAVAEFPLLLALFEIVYHSDSYTVTLQFAAVQLDVFPLYENVPVKTAFHNAVPSLEW